MFNTNNITLMYGCPITPFKPRDYIPVKVKEKSDWEKMKEFINSHEIGESILRSEMLQYIYSDKTMPGKCTTVDTNRRMMVVCGYLADTHQAGKYIVVRHLEQDLTSTKLRQHYDKVVKDFHICTSYT